MEQAEVVEEEEDARRRRLQIEELNATLAME